MKDKALLSYQLDETDQRILQALVEDARKPFTEIAADLGLSNSLVHQRIQKMRSSGLIEGYEVRMNEKILGYATIAYTGILLKDGKYSYTVAEALRQIPEIVECHFVAGRYAIFVRIVAQDNDHLRRILYDKIDYIEGVVGTESLVAFGPEFKRVAPVVLG